MIVLRGKVTAQRQPVVALDVISATGTRRSVDFLLDSGFNGTLALPESLVKELGLIFWFSRPAILADGSICNVDNFRGRVFWEGIERPTRVVASGEQPMIGMALLNGYRIIIDAVDGGEVTVESLQTFDFDGFPGNFRR